MIDLIKDKDKCNCKGKTLVSRELKNSEERVLKRKKDGKPLPYPSVDEDEVSSKIFQIKYEKPLSLTTKFILNSFQNKYIYYAIDDILYLFNLSSGDQKSLLSILYSPILSLQNNLSINFFDIWIDEIYIEEVQKVNRFLNKNITTSNQFNFITIKFSYKIKPPAKKRESLW